MTEDTREALSAYVARLGMTMTAEHADANPHMQPEPGAQPQDHWLCVLAYKQGRRKRTMRVPFSMGMGHNGKAPEIGDVLNCLALDAAGIANARGFEEWAREYGYAEDSRRAERTYAICKRQSTRLRTFLGEDECDRLLWSVNTDE